MNQTLPRRGSVPERTRSEHLELILETADVGVWELDVETGRAWRNDRHDEIFGYAELLPEWTFEMCRAHVLEADRDYFDERYGTALANGQPWSFECRIRRADGALRWISASGRPITDPEGRITTLIGHVIDVTHTKRKEEHLRSVLDELNHRVRNTLMVVHSIAARSFPDDVGVAEGRAAFLGRIDALAAAHALLTQRNWAGAPLAEVAARGLAPYREAGAGDRIRCDGPAVELPARAAVTLSMAIGELATNAVKHGALSGPAGTLSLSWEVVPEPAPDAAGGTAGPRVRLLWEERGGPPAERGPRSGFGTTLLERIVPADLGGTVALDFAPEGLRCRIEFPLGPLGTDTP
ncbi:sensor histidine kinase [Roseivivax sp. CAU 1761]